MTPDRIFAIFEVILALVLLFALVLLLMSATRAQRIVRFIKQILFGKKL